MIQSIRKTAIWVVAAVLCLLNGAVAAPRLRERSLDLGSSGLNLLGGSLPDDPFGKHGPAHTAGYYALNRTKDAEMFYFFFASRDDPANDPVVLWMTGGPGCSSELAVFYENGPFKINDDLSLRMSKYGWDKSHNMIFVDQPIGVGFSYSDAPEDVVYDEHAVAADMLDFVLDFLEAHPELADNDFYVTGESYAGHYVPAVTHRLWKWNKDGESPKISLKGFAIGNGLTDPAIQYGAYADFALDNQLISEAVHDRVNLAFPACRYGIEQCNGHGWSMVCKAALTYCQAAVFGQVMVAAGNLNVYDIRKTCDNPPLCYDFSRLQDYIYQEQVREALGVGDREWSECNWQVHADLMGDWMIDYANLLPPMLEDGVRGLIYAGDQDLICNWLGNRRWVDALQWSGRDAWSGEKDFQWSVDGAKAGLVHESGVLAFAKVYGAGHMVPMDQGKHALAMLEHLTRDKKFGDEVLHAEEPGVGADTHMASRVVGLRGGITVE